MDLVESAVYPPIQNPPPSGAVVVTKAPKTHLLTIILLVLLVAAVGAAAYFYGQSRQAPIADYTACLSAKGSLLQESYPATCVTKSGQRFIQPTPTPSSIADLSPENSAKGKALAEAPPGSTRFTSQKLGISFIYQTTQTGETFAVKEIGNKVYVYDTLYPYLQGQYSEVFDKESTESLVDAINRLIMPGFSTTDCEIKTPASGFTSSIIDPSFDTAMIGGLGIDEAREQGKEINCPQPYTAIGGLAYFVADPAHPTKFVFFSIGQYSINGDATRMWQDTLQFIN
ncbi:hypothetical protein A3B57_03105 [Microgenomates group bacterium RIFCSPLOWO2_01_FULL_47_10]|nr:MAG: hypothetical protein A3B57_03105 [Microgenomates group bacterium RIFCSPLOWO2_01_FULL_47_10]